MVSEKVKSKLDLVTNIFIILLCTVVGTILIRNHFFPKQQKAPPRPKQIEKGEQLDSLKQLVLDQAELTLCLIVSPSCPYCEKSIPFYKEIIEKRNAKNSSVKVVVVLDEIYDPKYEEKVFTKENVKVDRYIQIDMSSIKVASIPTILLINKEGKVVDKWKGFLRKEEIKNKVLEYL